MFSVAVQFVGLFAWDGAYHSRFDKGWGSGKGWVWQAPFETYWRIEQKYAPTPPAK